MRIDTMSRPPVRTITLGLADAHPLPFASITYAADTLQKASACYADAGYEVQTVRPDFPLHRVDLVADMLVATNAVNMTVQLASDERAPRIEAAMRCARVMKRLAEETPEGFGNFRFAALAHVAPGHPFFPAA